ncbi:hypothetical protein HAX54_051360 [Datura stramonium]|uniref:Non-haem dioxygenase N-terminal domain-containing protein n=1 Tax=Datura stramonium TaxID=4076 RepID=A0ABS8WR62_DATST|nr:hypothetical protein [Datura stramonium]
MIERLKLATATTPSSCSNPHSVIDLSKILNSQDFHYEIMKLSTSCEEWGSFQVTNHGLTWNLLEKMEKIIRVLHATFRGETEISNGSWNSSRLWLLLSSSGRSKT